jgi:hypothetical protein
MANTTLDDAVIRVKLDPSESIRKTRKLREQQERLEKSESLAEKRRVSKRDDVRREKEAVKKLQDNVNKIRSIAGGPGALVRSGVSRGLGATGMAGAASKAGLIVGGAIAATVAAEHVLTQSLPALTSGLKGMVSDSWIEPILGPVVDKINGNIQALADKVSAISAKVTTLLPSVYQTAQMGAARLKLGGGLPEIELGEGSLFAAIYKMNDAQKQFQKSVQRDANNYFYEALGRGLRGAYK